MLDYNPKLVTSLAGDQAILSIVVALCKQASLFYQRAGPEITNNNVRRHFVELEKLHRQASQLDVANHTTLATDENIAAICQWYQQHNTEVSNKTRWLKELPEQLSQQLAAFRRLNHELVQQENARALANLTASLQIRIDELNPLLRNTKI